MSATPQPRPNGVEHAAVDRVVEGLDEGASAGFEGIEMRAGAPRAEFEQLLERATALASIPNAVARPVPVGARPA